MSGSSAALNHNDFITNAAFRERAAQVFSALEATTEIFRERHKLSFGNMASTSASTTRKNAFAARVAAVRSPKSDINSLILDYLTMEGYHKAAEGFSKEANLQQQQEDWEIIARRAIQDAIHSGQIELAISGLNELDPEILDKEPKLHFALLRLQLVELIRDCNNGDISPAIQFATEQLGPRASTNPQFLDDLEKTMVLLIFPHDTLEPELAALLRSDLRKQVADEVNKTIVRRQTQRLETAIQELARMRTWGETSARAAKKDIPNRIELGLGEDGDNDSTADDTMNDGNGFEPMITI